jgi:hypothetical protein
VHRLFHPHACHIEDKQDHLEIRSATGCQDGLNLLLLIDFDLLLRIVTVIRTLDRVFQAKNSQRFEFTDCLAGGQSIEPSIEFSNQKLSEVRIHGLTGGRTVIRTLNRGFQAKNSQRFEFTDCLAV